MSKKRKRTFVVETGTAGELVGPFPSAEAAQRAIEKLYGEDGRYVIRPVHSLLNS